MWNTDQVKKIIKHLPDYVKAKVIVTTGLNNEPILQKYVDEYEKRLRELAEGIDT